MMTKYQLNYIESRIRKSNSKILMKYYTPKEFYNLFDYVIAYPNIWELEFFTLHPEYQKIWDYFKTGEMGYARLVGMEWDNKYKCYTVDISCMEFMEYIRHFNKDFHSTMSEKSWKSMVARNGWSEDEVNEGYEKYKQDRHRWFERHYGKHINLLR